MRPLLQSLRTTYLSADPRSLGLFRIAFGLVLLVDLARRYQQLDFWYTNAGLLPNHTLQWRPPAGHMFSLFFMASTRAEATVGFALCAIVFALFTVGYRTRTLQVLVLLCRVSVNSRLALLENGGDMVINLLASFSVALPLGRRFSVDALRSALRGAPVIGVDELNGTPRSQPECEQVLSLAMLGLILQFAAIYFFNAVSKSGAAWTDGVAVHYALHQDKFVTWFGVWMREHLPTSAFKLLTWSTLCVEWTGFALIITPVFVRQARLLAVLTLPFLHLAFALGLNLGTFSAAMISFFPLLLMRAHWDALSRWLQRRAIAQVVELDASDQRLLAGARLLRELDRFERISWQSSSRVGWRVRGLGDGAPRGTTVALLRALPWGFAFVWPLRIPGLGALLERALVVTLSAAADLAYRRRTTLFDSAPADVQRERRGRRWLAEAAVVVLMLAIATEIVNDNTSVPLWMRISQPAWAKAVIEYPRLLQGWRMFAPDPPMTDSMIYIDAITAAGRHVDPYNAAASRQRFPAGNVIPARMDQSQFFTMYSDRIAQPGYAAYRQAFLEWLLAYPRRTGQRSDCLTAFEAYLVTDRSPLPGNRAGPTPWQREKFMEYRAPGDSDCRPERSLEQHAVQTHVR
jgi:hypothetical protein